MSKWATLHTSILGCIVATLAISITGCFSDPLCGLPRAPLPPIVRDLTPTERDRTLATTERKLQEQENRCGPDTSTPPA